MRVGRIHPLRIWQSNPCKDVQHALATCCFVQIGVLNQHFFDLSATGHHRIKRGHGLLEHHAHAAAAQRTQARRCGVQQVFPLELDHAARGHQGLREQPHHGLSDDRLSGA